MGLLTILTEDSVTRATPDVVQTKITLSVSTALSGALQNTVKSIGVTRKSERLFPDNLNIPSSLIIIKEFFNGIVRCICAAFEPTSK